jgi:hypothetical protein
VSETKFTRRTFVLGVVAGVAGAVAASVAVCTCKIPRLLVLCGKFVPLAHEPSCPLAVALPPKRPTSVEPLESVCCNWWAFRQSWLQLVEAGYDIHRCELRAERRGYRRVIVTMRDESSVEFSAPWSLEAHQRENKHWGSIALSCDDCGTPPRGEHHWRCPHSTHLAHRLRGNWDEYHVI